MIVKMSARVLNLVDFRKFNEGVTEAKVKKEVEAMKRAYLTTEEEGILQPEKETELISGLKLQYSRLRLRNMQRNKDLEQLQVSLNALKASNTQAFAHLQESPHITSLKTTLAHTESAASEEVLLTEQLLSLLQNTKQASVSEVLSCKPAAS